MHQAHAGNDISTMPDADFGGHHPLELVGHGGDAARRNGDLRPELDELNPRFVDSATWALNLLRLKEPAPVLETAGAHYTPQPIRYGVNNDRDPMGSSEEIVPTTTSSRFA